MKPAMSIAPSIFDASQSALGYLHQCMYALLLALRRDDEPGLCLSIEKLDDIAFHESPTSAAVAKELLQVKHHIKRTGNLGDSSLDIWKTIRIWSEAVQNHQIDLGHATLCLVTTSTPNNRNAIRLLSPHDMIRKPEEARKKMEDAGVASSNVVVKEAYAAYMKLDDVSRSKLFGAIYLLDSSPSALDLPKAIGQAVRHVVEPHHRAAFVERLEGWWLQRVVIHLSSANNSLIPVEVIQKQVHELRSQFHRDCLPDDLFKETVPPNATPNEDDRLFVLQLLLIGLSEQRLTIAQQDHYRAFAQRSKWIKDNLIGMDELSNFELRLIDGWNLKFLVMKDGVSAGCAECDMARHGLSLYQWVETEAPSQSVLWVRPQFQSPYMTRGSYHMLADAIRVGWHPEYAVRLSTEPTPEKVELP